MVAERDDRLLFAASAVWPFQYRGFRHCPYLPSWANLKKCPSISPRPKPKSSRAASPNTAAGFWRFSDWPSIWSWSSAHRCWRRFSCRSALSLGPVAGFIFYIIKVLVCCSTAFRVSFHIRPSANRPDDQLLLEILAPLAFAQLLADLIIKGVHG